MKAIEFKYFIGTLTSVWFLPKYNHNEWIEGKVLGINLSD